MKKFTGFYVVALIALAQQVFAQQFRVEDTWPNIRFQFPVDVQYPPDNTNRLFVVQQNGIIRVMKDSVGTNSSSVFLNIANRITFSQNGETGLLGLAFHPDFANNGYFYVNYTRANPLRTIVSRFKVQSNNPNRADSLSEKEILSITQPFSNHNAGSMLFGNDGYLYITSGDGGSGNDPQNHGQRLNSLLGKILRIDVNTPDSVPYAIPPDNPFVNTPGARPEIFAYGLRNPWKMTIDREKGTIWMADVGQNAREEIDTLIKGANYGWRIMEGNICTPNISPSNCDQSPYVRPVLDYNNPSIGRSITGGYVYKGVEMPMLKNKYIFGDYVSRMVWYLQPNAQGNGYSMETLVNADVNISSFAQNKAGEIFVVAHSGISGRLLRIRCGDAQRPVIAGPSTQTICPGSSITLQAPQAAGYLWSNGETTQSITVNTPGIYTVRTRNAEGCYTDPSNAVQVVAATLPPLTISVVSNGNTLCQGDTARLIASSGYENYLWSTQQSAAQINVTQSGVYTVTGTLQGCTSNPVSVNVQFNPLPPAPVITMASNGLHLVATGTSGVASYTWIVNGSVVPNNNSDTLHNIICSDCNLQVQVAVTINGCTSAFSEPFIITALPEAKASSTNLVLYPNPVRDILHITISEQGVDEFSVQVLDIGGRTVKTWHSMKASQGKLKLKLNDLAAGSYRAIVASNGKIYQRSFVKK